MAYQDWVKAFPTRRTRRGKSKPGNGIMFRLDVRVHSKGNGFFRAPLGNINTHPVRDEQQAIAVFLDLWRKAQVEAQGIMDDAHNGGAD